MNRNLTVVLSAVVFALSLEAASPSYWQSGGSGGFADPSHWRDGNVPQAGWQVRFDGTTDAVVTDADM